MPAPDLKSSSLRKYPFAQAPRGLVRTVTFHNYIFSSKKILVLCKHRHMSKKFNCAGVIFCWIISSFLPREGNIVRSKIRLKGIKISIQHKFHPPQISCVSSRFALHSKRFEGLVSIYLDFNQSLQYFQTRKTEATHSSLGITPPPIIG